MPANKVYVVGLTGGTGCGKSEAARYLASMGAKHIDADAISRSLTAEGGAAIAAIVVLIMRSSMNTKRPQRSAGEYIDSSSYNLWRNQDIFLYSQVRKVRKQTQSSSGGGSSVHRSSGGRSHGGGHGRF